MVGNRGLGGDGDVWEYRGWIPRREPRAHGQFSSSRLSLGVRESFPVKCDKPQRLRRPHPLRIGSMWHVAMVGGAMDWEGSDMY